MDSYMDWQIEECIEILEERAKETGDALNAIMSARCAKEGTVWQGAPLAYQATNSWHAIEIIRQLQTEIAELRGTCPR